MRTQTFIALAICFIATSCLAQGGKQTEALKEVLMNIHWYGQAAFRIEDGEKEIYIDPWNLPTNLPKADYIFITHGHFDHYSAEDIDKVKKPETKIIAPEDVAKKIGKRATAVKPNQTIQVDALEITTVPAYNLKKRFHPKAEGWVGYLITLSSGERIYHAGDTDFVPEMEAIEADIILLPVGGTYTMDAKEAAKAANAINPKVAIPMHFGDVVGSDKDAETFKKQVKAEVIIKSREK